MADDPTTRCLRIHGRVQGVGFRAYVEYQARQLGLHGWVRNRSDGSVEALIQGTPAAVATMIECAHRGPRGAQVTTVEVRPGCAVCSSFEIRPTT